MAYSVISMTTLDDVPGQVRAFAAGLGWTAADVSATESTVQHPTYTTALTFTIRAELTGVDDTRIERLELTTDLAGGDSGWVYSPKLNPSQTNVATAVEVSQPTKLHLFGELAGDSSDPGDSWIAGVIEYGYNLYRHFFLGYPNKLSGYAGGELVSGSWQHFSHTADHGTYDFDEFVSGFPFAATGHFLPNGTDHVGGMHLDHAGNATPWRIFYMGSDVSSDFDTETATWADKCIIGGYRDSINDGFLHAGKSPYSGAQVLVPINLYIGQRNNGQTFFQGVGCPGGVRLVHMEDLEPGQQVTVGSNTWRVFPIFARREETTWPDPDLDNFLYEYPAYNTSYYVGMAYREA